MTDWKNEHDAELGLRREWSARAQKAEAEIERLRAENEKLRLELEKIAWMEDYEAMQERLCDCGMKREG